MKERCEMLFSENLYSLADFEFFALFFFFYDMLESEAELIEERHVKKLKDELTRRIELNEENSFYCRKLRKYLHNTFEPIRQVRALKDAYLTDTKKQRKAM